MTEVDLLEPLIVPVSAIQRIIERLDDQGIVIGGVAASLLGEPRLTADADALLLLSIEEVPWLLEMAQAEGLLPRIENPVEFASRSRVVLLRHVESGIDVDISLGLLPFDKERIRFWVQQFADLLEAPEIWTDVEILLGEAR